jgi:hypothetical protein
VLTLAGRPISLVTVHAGFFVLFGVATGLHLLARFVPALSLATGRPRRSGDAGRPVPGERRRTMLLVATAAAAVLAVAVVVPSVQGWQHDRHDHERAAATQR